MPNLLTAPLIWIFVPLLAGLVFWIIRRRETLMLFLSSGLCLLLAFLAWLLPIEQTVKVSRVSFTINSTLEFVGRKLLLDNTDRPLLILIFLICAFWFAGSRAARSNALLIPFGFGMVALLVAALAVEPFLYAALLIEMAVLLAVPILAPSGRLFGQGVLRFLIFQTLAMPFILLAGWALAGVENNPNNQTLVMFAAVFLALGFAFWLAVFPFYTWIPLLAEQTHPYSSGFVFLLLPTVQLLVGLNFLDRFGWLRASPMLFSTLTIVGAVMVVTAGIWAVFQRDMARLLGYGVIVETGYSLLAVSLSSHTGNLLFASMFLPRAIGLGLWALSLSVLLQEAGSTKFESFTGLAQKMPFAATGLAMAPLALGGLPLLAAFPIHQVLLELLARQSLLISLSVMGGSIGLLFSAFRMVAALARGTIRIPVLQALVNARSSIPSEVSRQPDAPVESQPPFCESRLQIVLLIGGMVGLVLIGVFPQAFLPTMQSLLIRYTQLP